MNEKSLVDVLKFLSEKLDGCKWALYGSLNLRLHGLDIETHDIDVMTTPDYIFEIDKRLSSFRIEDVVKISKPHGEIYRAIYDIDGLEVDIIAEISLISDGRSLEVADKLDNLDVVEHEGLKVPCYNLKYEYEIYKILNRDKDKDKLRFIEGRIFR